jgi:hypothetical protein
MGVQGKVASSPERIGTPCRPPTSSPEPTGSAGTHTTPPHTKDSPYPDSLSFFIQEPPHVQLVAFYYHPEQGNGPLGIRFLIA